MADEAKKRGLSLAILMGGKPRDAGEGHDDMEEEGEDEGAEEDAILDDIWDAVKSDDKEQFKAALLEFKNC